MTDFKPEPRSPGAEIKYEDGEAPPLLEKVDTEAKLAVAPWHDPKVKIHK